MKMRGDKIASAALLSAFLVISLLSSLPVGRAQQPAWLPVPRDQAVIVETDVDPAVFDKANPFIPGGTQWGSGWHQNVVEWDWYINYITGEYILWRISGWEYRDNFRTFILKIRDGVKWNDGVQYTADDIVFSVNLQKQYFTSSFISLNVESARAIDKLTVEIRLKDPNPRFHHVFRMWGPNGEWVRPKHVWEGKDPLTFANWPPVETGPYKLWKV
ncbi:MAG: ABC transporter substrate-binding protein, partial [Nitrososphaerota archaeon]